MRIALVIEQFDLVLRGAQRSCDQMARELAARGHEVTVLTGKGPIESDVPGMTVRVAPAGRPRWGINVPPFVRWVRKQLREGDFDVSLSVSSWLPGDVIQPRAGIVAEAQRRLVARRETAGGRLLKHVELCVTPKQQLMRWLERRQLTGRRVKKIIAISDYMAEQLERHFGLNGSHVERIPNGSVVPDIERAAERRRVRAELGLKEETTVYLFVTTDPLRKGIKPMFRAMQHLNGRDAALLVVGDVPEHLRRQLVDDHLEGKTRFLGSVGDVTAHYCAADVTVLPTYYDPSSKVIIESLMLGTPVITTAFNGARDFIDGNGRPRPGRVVSNPQDVAALVEAMTEMADPDELRRCRAATAGLADKLSMRRHVDGVEDVLREAATSVAR